MLSILKKLGKLTAGYSLVTLINPLFVLLLTPLYTRVLSPADYGVVAVANTFAGLVSILVALGFDQAMGALFFDKACASAGNYRKNLVTTGLICIAGSSAVASVLILFFAETLAVLFFQDAAHRVTMQFVGLLALTMPSYLVISTSLRLRMGIKRLNALGLSSLFFSAALNILFILILRMKATGVIAALAVANTLSVGVGIALLWEPLRGRFDANLARHLLKVGVSVLPAIFGYVMLNTVDRLILTQYVSQADLGYYDIANKLGSVANILVSTAMGAYVPMALELAHTDQDAPAKFARMYEYFLAVASFLTLGIGLFAPDLIRLLLQIDYLPAAPFVLALGFYFGPLIVSSAILSIGLHVTKNLQWISVAYLLAVPTNVVLNLLLDNRWGIWGAAWATLAGGVVLAMATYWFCQKHYPIQYRWRKLLVVIGVHLLLCFGFASSHTLQNSLLFKLGALSLLAGVLIATNLIPLVRIAEAACILRNKVMSFGKLSA
jgi:O-antigen/teichoic acid export membrane protein